ncbi:MAG: M16 family metallopeptidase [Marinifilaceae bacterium]
MKTLNIFIMFLVVALFVSPADAQVDRTKAPAAGPAPKIQLGDYDSFVLKNGMKVLVVENHKLPKVSFNLSLNIDPVVEGDKAGYVSFVGSLLDKGTSKRNNQKIAEEIDFIGARLGTYSDGAYASGLSRYKETILELMADVVQNPTFPQEEFDKVVKQSLSALQGNKTEPTAILQNVRSRVLYGEDHPYGDVETEATVKNIKVEDCKAYYNTYFKPNVAIMAIVGDITTKEAKKLMKKYFGAWERGEVPVHKYDLPAKIEGKRVVLSNKDAASQSNIQIVHTVDLKKGHPDVIPVEVMNSMLGRGFMGLLTQNLREDKGYTYGSRSSIQPDKLVSCFVAGAGVGTNVTDSALVEIAREMNRVRNEKLTQDHLNMTKATLAGDFARALEEPGTIAAFARDIEMYNLPHDYYATYLQKLEKITLDDVQAVAKKYVDPENAIYLVVGDRGLKEKLARLSSTGKVEEYDFEGNEVKEDPNAIPAGVTVSTILDHYLDALGGRDKVAAIKDVSIQGNMKMGPMTVDMEINYLNNEKFMLKMVMNGQLMQGIRYNGKVAKVAAMGQEKELTGEQAKPFAMEAQMIPELNFEKLGFEAKIVGVEKIDGEKAYKLQIKGADDKIKVEFFGADSGLKLKTIAQENGMTQIMVYKDYREVEGVKFPYSTITSVGPQEMPLTVTEIKVNSNLDASIFN